jgi:hypothetical protein
MKENEKNSGSKEGAVNGGAGAKPLQPLGESAGPILSGDKIISGDSGSHACASNNTDNDKGSKNSDLFSDLANLRLGQDFGQELGLAKPLATVPIRKPGKNSFIRVHPDPAYRFQTAVIDLKEEGETYLVVKPLWSRLVSEPAFVPKVLVTYMARPGDVLGVWPIRMPGPDGRLDDYNQSALNIGISLATKSWVRVNANRHLGAYEATVAPAGISWGEPLWPDMPFSEILRIAFKDRVIEDLDHPVLKRLRGEL